MAGELKACVTESGSMTLLKSGKHCKRGQKEIAWNQRGLAGPVGPSGSKGASGAGGANGAPGPAGTSPAEATFWARVNKQGGLEVGRGVTGVQGSGPGFREVTFNRDVSNCGFVVTQSEGFTAFTTAFADPGKTNTVIVNIYKEGTGAIEAAFTLAVLC